MARYPEHRPNAWLSVSNCSFSSNNATYGGGLVNWSATATVSSSTFSNNSAGDGGGIKNLDGSLTVSNSTFSANRANTGGGISNGSFSDVNMINCTLSATTPITGAAHQHARRLHACEHDCGQQHGGTELPRLDHRWRREPQLSGLSRFQLPEYWRRSSAWSLTE